MAAGEFHLRTERVPYAGLVIEAEGYLDDAGGTELLREAAAALPADCTCIRIDLDQVVLFTCAGARRLLALLHALEERGLTVELVHVHPPLRRALELSA